MYACIASIPERYDMLQKTVESLRPQVEGIFVTLNNYVSVPEFLKEENTIILDNNKGDAGKFWFVDKLQGYILTCDDDIIYPPSYVRYMTSFCKQYDCPVTLHGKTFNPDTAFNRPLAIYRCLDDVLSDGRVDVGGTGVMCFHTDQVKISYDYFGSANMADLWFAKACKEQDVRIMCLAHQKGWLSYQNPAWTVWDSEKDKGFTEQTKLLRSFI